MDKYIRQRELIDKDALDRLNVEVIGCGSIGRNVAMMLASIGTNNIRLVDYDIVELLNVPTQGFFEDEVGRLKVDAVMELCSRINPEADVKIWMSEFEGFAEDKPADVVFCCVDTMSSRDEIFKACCDSGHVKLFIDGRMASEAIRMFTVDTTKDDAVTYYTGEMFSDDEASRERCTRKSTIYCSNVAAGFMVSNFSRWLRGKKFVRDLSFNLPALTGIHL